MAAEADDDPLVCYCMGVSRGRLERAIREEGARSVEDLQRLTMACCGCGTCRWDVQAVLDRVRAEAEADADDDA